VFGEYILVRDLDTLLSHARSNGWKPDVILCDTRLLADLAGGLMLDSHERVMVDSYCGVEVHHDPRSTRLVSRSRAYSHPDPFEGIDIDKVFP